MALPTLEIIVSALLGAEFVEGNSYLMRAPLHDGLYVERAPSELFYAVKTACGEIVAFGNLPSFPCGTAQ